MLFKVLLVLSSPLLFLCLWIGIRLLYCFFNYKVCKRNLRDIPRITDPFARLKILASVDPCTYMWKENIKLAGQGNAFLPVVFIGPYIDMGRPVVMVNSPELIREVSDDIRFPKLPAYYDPAISVIGDGLATAKGERWKNHRAIISPMFNHVKLKEFAKKMSANADELIASLKKLSGKEVNCAEILSETTLSVFIDCIFSREDLDPKWAAKLFSQTNSWLQVFALTELIFGPTVNSVFPWKRFLNKTKALLHGEVFKICERARRHSTEDTFVGLLVSAKDENGKQALSDVEIAEEAMTLLFAGYDTTKNAIAWTLYFLCQHQNELEKVQQEADIVLQGRTATFDDIPKLQKCKNAITEAQRLRPGGTGLDRLVLEDTILGGYNIPKGTSIFMHWYGAHTDPTLWDNPEIYNPDRFDYNPGFAKNFFGFSYGPRICLGQKFATNEAIIVTASLLQYFDLYMGSGVVRPTMKVSLEPEGFNCKFIPRHKP